MTFLYNALTHFAGSQQRAAADAFVATDVDQPIVSNDESVEIVFTEEDVKAREDNLQAIKQLVGQLQAELITVKQENASLKDRVAKMQALLNKTLREKEAAINALKNQADLKAQVKKLQSIIANQR